MFVVKYNDERRVVEGMGSYAKRAAVRYSIWCMAAVFESDVNSYTTTFVCI